MTKSKGLYAMMESTNTVLILEIKNEILKVLEKLQEYKY